MQQQLTRDETAASTENERTADAANGLPSVFPYGERAGEAASIARRAPGTEACPDCGGETINGQGALDCRNCDWVGLP